MEQALFELLTYIRRSPRYGVPKHGRSRPTHKTRKGIYIVAYKPKHSKRRIYGRYDDYNSALYDLGKLRGHKKWKSHIYNTSWEVIN